jgi:uncharacterized membrane protein YphA (DoxX/SURF4 family)
LDLNTLAGLAIVIILLAMASSWLIRGLLLKLLRNRHPQEFAGLGHPSNRQLASLFPRDQELQIQFWKYLWGGRIFLVNDKLVSSLAVAALIADVALVIGVIILLWTAANIGR